MKKRIFLQGILWFTIYLFLILAPLIVLMLSPRPAGREFWRELSVALGFVGLSMMSLQFVLTARFKWLKSPYGADIVYHFHRQISLVAFALIALHPLLLFFFDPSTLGLLNLVNAPWRARAGVTAFVSAAVMIAISVWRKPLKIKYTPWRILHGALAIAAVTLAMTHTILVGHYINLPWKRAIWIAYIALWVGLLIYIRILKPILLMRKPYEAVSVTPERGSCWSLTLRPQGHSGFHFLPGQFAWLTVWDTPFADSEHPFSISSSAAHNETLTFTIKEFGEFTRRVKDIRPGQKVFVDGPYGSFSIDRHPHAVGFVFIAGGIGITPMMSMLRTLADRADRRTHILFYANRNPEAITFMEELDLLRKKLDLKVVHVLQDAPPNWQGETGLMRRDLLEKYLPARLERDKIEFFVCGPLPMMDAVEKILDEMKVWPGDYHSERFDLV